MKNELTCEKCGGTGQLFDHGMLRAKRLSRGVKAGFIAAQMGISASHLCDLEHGRRRWNAELAQKFNKSLL